MSPYVNMKFLPVIYLLLGAVLAVEKQINLEDIERDNLKSERLAQAQRSQNPPNQAPQQLFVTPRPELSVGPHLFLPEAREYSIFQHFAQQPSNQPPQYIQQLPRLATIPGHPGIVTLPTVQSQQQPSFTHYIPQVQQQGAYFPQGYIPDSRYAVLQTPSTTAQTVANTRTQYPYVDPNTELLKSPNLQQRLTDPKQSHNFAGLLQRYAHTNFLQQNYQPPVPQAYALQSLGSQPIISRPVYVLPQPTATTLNPTFQRTNQALGQQRYLVPGINYARSQQPQIYSIQPSPIYATQATPIYSAQPSSIYATQQAQPSTSNLVYEKNGPLVGVYVPSALQLQYLKQLRQQPSAIVQPGNLKVDVSTKTVPASPLSIPYAPTTNLQYPFPIYNKVK